MTLSVLKNSKENCITYYNGENIEHVSHLKNCTLICKPNLNFNLPSVNIVESNDPQLYFYKLSESYKKDYLGQNRLKYVDKYKSHIHEDAQIEDDVVIFPNCVIGSVKINSGCVIHPNTVIYSETIIGKNVTIESNSVIGAEGVMWVWDKGKRIKLHQLGNVVIEDNVFIGSNVTIVRGSANESTYIGNSCVIAHGSMIGHGSYLSEKCHLANNVSIGGSVYIANESFLGSGSVVSPGTKINKTIVLGSNSLAINIIDEEGVYVGSPSKKIKEINGKMNGVPEVKK
jgi:UDP-3-O-[3-hydroxymyristoyl] glucosamine N-acyltransferase